MAIVMFDAAVLAATAGGFFPLPESVCLLIIGQGAMLSWWIPKRSMAEFNNHLIVCAVAVSIIAWSVTSVLWIPPATTAISPLQECIILIAALDFSAAIGGRLLPLGRLAPAISPNKSVSGAVVGMAAGITVWFTIDQWITSAFTLHQTLAILLAGVMGDLFFSSVKRSLEVKDFSRILGVKGGVLDRMDGTIFSVLVTGYLLSVHQAGPF